MKKRERYNESAAQFCEKIGGKNSQGARFFRAINRRIDRRRGASKRKAKS